MSWTRSILPTFHLLLLFLLAGDLSSGIFVGANALDCTYGWSSPVGKKKYSCYTFKGKGPAYDTHICEWCGRNDKLKPAARDCVNESGVVQNGGGPWACDVTIDVDGNSHSDGRQIVCNHIDKDGTIRLYYCKARHVDQQCPESKCKLVG
ncbi:secreted protein [Melampsora americana]|nr:secreted protein [Melampsora americana]